MEKYMIGVTIAFFFVLFAILIGSMFYGISKINQGTPVENNFNSLGESNGGEKSSPDSGGSGGGGELGTISPLSRNGSKGSAGGGGGSSGGGGGGGEGSGNETEAEEEPPSDLYTAPCGVYFAGYGVCNGSCSEGICTQEGRSCYCKLP